MGRAAVCELPQARGRQSAAARRGTGSPICVMSGARRRSALGESSCHVDPRKCEAVGRSHWLPHWRSPIVLLALALTPGGAHAQATDFPNRPSGHRLDAGRRRRRHRTPAASPKACSSQWASRSRSKTRPGAGGNIAAEAVFNAAPDGYTLLASQPAPITTNPLLYKCELRPDQAHAGRDHGAAAERAAGAGRFPGQDRAGADRLRQGQSGQAQLRLARHRHHIASDRGAVLHPSPIPSLCMCPTKARRRRSTISWPAMST